jgi:hypothetical protein
LTDEPFAVTADITPGLSVTRRRSRTVDDATIHIRLESSGTAFNLTRKELVNLRTFLNLNLNTAQEATNDR